MLMPLRLEPQRLRCAHAARDRRAPRAAGGGRARRGREAPTRVSHRMGVIVAPPCMNTAPRVRGLQ
jgi:hypothetical protein